MAQRSIVGIQIDIESVLVIQRVVLPSELDVGHFQGVADGLDSVGAGALGRSKYCNDPQSELVTGWRGKGEMSAKPGGAECGTAQTLLGTDPALILGNYSSDEAQRERGGVMAGGSGPVSRVPSSSEGATTPKPSEKGQGVTGLAGSTQLPPGDVSPTAASSGSRFPFSPATIKTPRAHRSPARSLCCAAPALQQFKCAAVIQ